MPARTSNLPWSYGGTHSGWGQYAAGAAKVESAPSHEEWQAKVNQIIDRLAGLDADDLPDMPYADWYAAGLSPAVAAHEALTESGWADEYDEDEEGEYE